MKLKTWLPAILAVLLGGAAAFLVRNSMMRPKASPIVVTPKMTSTVIATSDLIAGQEILGENITAIDLPTNPNLTDAMAHPADVVGRVLAGPVAKGQPIRSTSLAPRGSMATLPSLVPPGMRAITISVDETNSQAGMISPGCHVDVLASVAAGKDSMTRTLVPNVLVQAVGQRLTSARPEDGKEPPPYHTITMIVTLREAQLIDLAVLSARMRILLRPLSKEPADETASDHVTLADMLGNDEKPYKPAPIPTTVPSTTNEPRLVSAAPAKNDVILILGNTISHVKVDMPETTPRVQMDTNADMQPVIEGREPEQD